MKTDKLARRDIPEYVRSMQQDYGAARLLNREAVDKARLERQLLSEQIGAILESIAPLLPDEVRYEIYVADSVPAALTRAIDDGGQLVLIGRHFVAFLRHMIAILVAGIEIEGDGAGSVRYPTGEEKTVFGRVIGEYLELGVPITFPRPGKADIAADILVAAMEFLIAHEIVHQVEAHSDVPDLTLTGFQDFCRLRGREFLCDKRAVSLVLLRRVDTDMPELAFLGAVSALLAISWLEQFTPGFQPGGEDKLFHPGTDSRVLRMHLEEQLTWRAAKLASSPNDLTGAILRRAFLFVAAFEHEPKLLVTPLNQLARVCLREGIVNHDLFDRVSGEWLARGRVQQVASALGSMWGSSELMAAEEASDASISDRIGTLAVPLYERLHRRLAASSSGGRATAEEMSAARAYRCERPDAF